MQNTCKQFTYVSLHSATWLNKNGEESTLFSISRKELNPSGKIPRIKKEDDSSFPSTGAKITKIKSILILCFTLWDKILITPNTSMDLGSSLQRTLKHTIEIKFGVSLMSTIIKF